ncbi:hypothetical protein RRG08_059859 [Elysia crispata]|uniref:Uncharacterized protein n=1 Tax=Elysia crispata TaxID=231223 RepID=A0AAE1DW40_9GAST|nr:hypothetical protein RRG08_059859 [Elysia crispata]
MYNRCSTFRGTSSFPTAHNHDPEDDRTIQRHQVRGAVKRKAEKSVHERPLKMACNRRIQCYDSLDFNDAKILRQSIYRARKKNLAPEISKATLKMKTPVATKRKADRDIEKIDWNLLTWSDFQTQLTIRESTSPLTTSPPCTVTLACQLASPDRLHHARLLVDRPGNRYMARGTGSTQRKKTR